MPEIITITDPMASELDFYTRCSEAELRHYFEPDGGVFVAESPAVISLALDAGLRPISLLVPERDVTGAAAQIIARMRNAPVYAVGQEVLSHIPGFQLIRGAMCAMHRPKPMPVDQLLANRRRIAVLDNIENPTNVGAIIRSAAALGMDAVVLTADSSDPLYRRSARVSMGTVFQIPWTYLEAGDYICRLRQMGFSTVAMALREKSLRLDDPIFLQEEKLAIVLGTEGYGLPAETIDACDHTVMIPMSHGVDSLNVAAASAVAFWQLGRR